MTALKKADTVIGDQQKALDLSKLAITQARDENAALQKEVDDSNSRLAVWYRNPYVLTLIGGVGGILLGAAIFKR